MLFGQKINHLKSEAIKATGSVSHFLDRRLFSLGIFQSWIFLIFHSSVIITFQSSSFNLVYASTILFAVIALILGALIKNRRHSRVLVLIFGTISSTFSTFAICFFPFEGIGLFIVSLFLGLGVGIFIPFVGKIFSSVKLEVATQQVFLSFALAALLYFLFLGFPNPIGVILTSLLPVALLLIILAPLSSKRMVHHHQDQTNQDKVREIIHSRPVIVFFIGVGFLGLAFGFSMSFCSLHGLETFNAANRWSVLLTGVGALLYFFIMRPAKRPFDFSKCFNPVPPIIAIGLLIFSYDSFSSSIFIILGFQLADMVIWIVFTWIAGHSGLSQRVFCIGKSCMYSGMLIGVIGVRFTYISSYTGQLPLIIASIFTYLLILTIIFIFNNSNVINAIKSYSSTSDLNHIAKAIELRCEELGQLYGLTAREKEMFGYLAQGRSLPYIESIMHISHGTANSHRDHIYLKTKIHSKQELLDLFFGAIK